MDYTTMEYTGFENNKNPNRILSNFIQMRFFRVKSILPLLFGISLFYLIFYTSCANIGSPSGGLKDSIPPVILKTIPELRGTDFKGADVRFTFNEFIIPDEISEKLVISPPMKKKPVIKMKGKTLIVEFSEDLRKDIRLILKMR